MKVIVERCGFLDVHRDSAMACARTPDGSGGRRPVPVRAERSEEHRGGEFERGRLAVDVVVALLRAASVAVNQREFARSTVGRSATHVALPLCVPVTVRSAGVGLDRDRRFSATIPTPEFARHGHGVARDGEVVPMWATL